MELSSKEPHLSREPWRKGLPNQVQWRPHELNHMLERRPATSPERPTAPSAEEPDVLATASGEPTAVLTRELAAPPTPLETDKKVEESPVCEFPSWTAIHPSHPVTPVGQVPSSLGNLRQHCQSHSSSRRSTQHCCMEEQRSGGQGDSSSALLHKSSLWKIHQKCHYLASDRSPSL